MASKFDQFPEVQGPQGFERYPEVGQQQAAPQQQPQAAAPPPAPAAQEKPGWRSKAEEVWNRIRSAELSDVGAGIVEPAIEGATGALGTVAGGLTGIAQGFVNTVDPAEQSGEPVVSRGIEYPRTQRQEVTAGDRVGRTQEAMTYQPRTEAGQAVSDAIAYPFEKYDRAIDYVAETAGDPDDVLGATMAYTAMALLPALFGRKAVSRKDKGKDKPADSGDVVPTIEELKKQSNALYRQADEANLGINASSYDTMLGRVREKLASEGFDEGLNPATARALKRLEADAGKNLSLKGAEVNRRVINNARATMEKADSRLAGEILDIYDNWLGTLGKGDVLAGDVTATSLLPKARNLWSRAKKADELDYMVRRAADRAGGFQGSGFQNALVTEFRQLVMNKKRMRGFTPEEQAALRRVARGDATTNFFRYIGKLAPTGIVSGTLGGGAAAMTPLGPVLGPMTVWTAGGSARKVSEALTKRNIESASELIRRGPAQ